MEKLKQMKECLTDIVENQIYSNMDKVEAKELGEAIDMIKDLAEAIYYCTITEAMEGDKYAEQGGHRAMYYAPHNPPMDYYEPHYKDKYPDMMYADGPMGSHGGSRMYHDGASLMRKDNIYPMRHDGYPYYPIDPREGRSGMHRKMYMEGRGLKDKAKQMQELENYMQELAQDMTEMIQDASPEEKQLLQQRVANLAAKIK